MSHTCSTKIRKYERHVYVRNPPQLLHINGIDVIHCFQTKTHSTSLRINFPIKVVGGTGNTIKYYVYHVEVTYFTYFIRTRQSLGLSLGKVCVSCKAMIWNKNGTWKQNFDVLISLPPMLQHSRSYTVVGIFTKILDEVRPQHCHRILNETKLMRPCTIIGPYMVST